ncbi:MAG: hypothetical protein ACRDBX_08570 [Erysipelotrichaceae bacterium]
MQWTKKQRKQALRAKNKQYEKLHFDYEGYLHKHYDVKDDVVTLHLKLATLEDALSTYASAEQLVINPSLLEQIEQLVEPIPNPYSLILDLDVSVLPPALHQTFQDKLHAYFAWKLADINQDLDLNRAKIVGLFVFGSLLLLLYYWLSTQEASMYLTEVMSIAGTFALWEFVDFWLLERRQLKFQRLAMGQLATMKITLRTK